MTEDGTGNPNFNTDVITVVNLDTSHLAFVIYSTTQKFRHNTKLCTIDYLHCIRTCMFYKILVTMYGHY